ncbi:hypothetical protein LguiA_003137 [Lonicera macranthoides]
MSICLFSYALLNSNYKPYIDTPVDINLERMGNVIRVLEAQALGSSKKKQWVTTSQRLRNYDLIRLSGRNFDVIRFSGRNYDDRECFDWRYDGNVTNHRGIHRDAVVKPV